MVDKIFSSPNIYGHPNYEEFAGLSTDTKPEGDFLTGSTFHELDTKTVYCWDRENQTWIEQGTLFS